MEESPISSSPRLPAQPNDASKDQREDQNNAPVSPYTVNILESSVCDSLWTAIEEDVAVTTAHRKLASRRQSDDKQPCATFLFNERFATGARVRTGTPMFIACELSSSAKGLVYGDTSLKRLGRKLRAVEELGRACPGDDSDGTFMKKFQLVLEAEEERVDSGVKVTTNPQTAHLPRHDIESVFWVLPWSLARACPEGAAFEDSDGPFSKWASVMLRHTIGDETSRWFQLNAAQGLGAMLHADLEHFDTLIEDIAAYLVVPWARYKDMVDEDHAHVAIRRLLLAAIHALANGPSKDVRLNTLQSRVLNLQSLIAFP